MTYFKDKYVRDLYWLLSSHSPIREKSIADLPMLPYHFQEAWLKEGMDFLIALDECPEPLHDFLEKRSSFRLGIYAEYLIQYFFENAPHIELLAHHVQLIQDKITIGEIDFILEFEGKVFHIELAVKYYLQESQTDSFTAWIGPSGKDTLARKVKKVKEHQLPLIASPILKEQYSFKELQSFFWLRGVFFSNENAVSTWHNPNALYGRYFRVDELKDTFFEQQKHYIVLKRPHWMMDTQDLGEHAKLGITPYLADKTKLRDAIDEHGALLVKNKTNEEIFFIVSDQWPFQSKKKVIK